MGELVDTALRMLMSDEFMRAYYAIAVTGIVLSSISLASGIYSELEKLRPIDFSAPNTGNKTQDCEKVAQQLVDARKHKTEKGRTARRNAFVVAMLGVVVPTAILVITVLLLPWLVGKPGLVWTDGSGALALSPSPQDIFGLFVQAVVTEDGLNFIKAFVGTPDAFRVAFDTSNLLVFLLLVGQKVWAIAFLKDLAVDIAPKIWRFSTEQSEREAFLRTKLAELKCEV